MSRTTLSATGLKSLAAIAICLEICVGGAPDARGAPISAQEIVDQFYPTSLTSASPAYPWWTPQDKESAFVVMTTLPTGDPETILAAYTNGIGGAVRVIKA